MTTKWSVPRSWEGETVAVLASGPSMNAATCDAVRGKCRVIAVNNQAIDTTVNGVRLPALAPWADVLYAADAKWWKEHYEDTKKFEGIKITVRDVLPWKEIMSLEQSINVPFDARPTHIVTGGNSGYQAVHLAAHFGAKRILLLGFDMREVNGRRHWFGSYTNKKLDSKQNYHLWINNFAQLGAVLAKNEIEVINCTPKSALSCFPRKPLSEVLL